LFHPTAGLYKTMGDGKFRVCASFYLKKVFRLLLLRQKASAEFGKTLVKTSGVPIVIFDDLTFT
jgi:hypothetical protein